MLSRPLPQNPTELMRWDWDDFAPLVHELNERRVTYENVEIWLSDWSHLNEAVEELSNRLLYAISADTADLQARDRYTRFLDRFLPYWSEAENNLKKQLLDSGLEVPGFEVQLEHMRQEADLFREQNLPLISQEETIATEYDQIMGAQAVVWDNQELTITQLRPIMEERDRQQREEVWRLGAERQLADREAINHLWTRLLDLRRQIAANAGRSDYRAYRWQELLRTDYSPQDTENFRKAIEEVVVPAASRLYERRRVQLALDSLRPWDLDVDPFGRPPLHPFYTMDELKQKASAVFHMVHPELGDYFDTMVAEQLLDLENRKNKAPGAYCTDFSMIQRPFIFANTVGMQEDVQTVLHESGHAFHAFEASPLPYNQQRHTGSEFAEVASMGMELLAGRYLDTQPGGFYDENQAERARAQHLESCILFWPYMAVVDGFQDWAYTHPDQAARPANCDQKWGELWQRFMPGVDWSGLDDAMETGWQRKLHIFTVPLYYVEYGLAQLGAVQIWSRSLKDPAGAVSAYRRALALGGTVPLRELYETAGARLSFDPENLSEAVSTMETIIFSIDQHQPPAG